MVNNVNTNPGALIALQNLTRVSESLEETQRRVSTGLEVSSARDNPAVFALAQNQRAQLGSIESVQQGLSIGSSTLDVALAAGEAISDILVELRGLAVQAADESLAASDRTLIQDQFSALTDQITRLVDSADVGGRNLINNSTPAGLTLIAGPDGTSTISVAAQNLNIGGGILSINDDGTDLATACLLYTSPSPRDRTRSRMPSSA